MTEKRQFARRTFLAGTAAASAAAATGLGVSPAEAVNPTNRVDFATWDPVSDRSTTAMNPRRVIFHISDSYGADIYGPQRVNGNYAHFYNPRSAGIRQHQTMNKVAAADLNGSAYSISVEQEGKAPDSMTGKQLEDLAKVFAWAIVYCGVPDKIATVNNVDGLAWHRLGIDGNFGTYNPNNRKTWCRKQTGAVWSSASGKVCPTNNFIDQIEDVYSRSRKWVDYYRHQPPPG